MPTVDNVTVLSDFKGELQRQAIDELGAEAFLFLRDGAQQQGLPPVGGEEHEGYP